MKSNSNPMNVRKTVQSDNFGLKATVLGLTIERQVELLNQMYHGKLKFKLAEDDEHNKIIDLYWINHDVNILELPEVDNLRIGYVPYDNNVRTLKLNKNIRDFKPQDLWKFPNLVGLWIWDSLEYKHEQRIRGISILVIQHLNGKKPSVVKF